MYTIVVNTHHGITDIFIDYMAIQDICNAIYIYIYLQT